ncbi:unnamed protein product [Somion occarium]|uniref:Symplekin n=1 Tax=Somion occarium TaxID=3059160 RepID=A0ABP1E777_9APHY
MANPVDPLQTLSTAWNAPANSKEQADTLAVLRESLEAHPQPIPVLFNSLIKALTDSEDSLLRRWVLDLLHFAICRSSLSTDTRTILSLNTLNALAGLLNDSNPATVKVVVQCFATVYPLVFRYLCANRNHPQVWDVLVHCKARILEFVDSPYVGIGIKLSAIKFMQRVILVQTKSVSDPRLQNKNDPNLSMCPTDHPFLHVPTLDAEGLKLLERVITILYTNNNPEIISAILNSWASLAKQRPGLTELVISTLEHWTPANLAGHPAHTVKSVEKSVRILLLHLSRLQLPSNLAGKIHHALAAQATRMEQASIEEKQRKAAEASRKRPPSAVPTEESPDAKRMKLEENGMPTPSSYLAGFDFATLPSNLVIDLVIANLQAFSEPSLAGLVQAYLDRVKAATAAAAAEMPPGLVPPPAPIAAPVPAAPISAIPTITPSAIVPTIPVAVSSQAGTPVPVAPPTAPRADREKAAQVTEIQPHEGTPEVKEEPVDPLKMDIDDEEVEYAPEKLAEQEAEQEAAVETEAALEISMDLTLDLQGFHLPPPKELSDNDREVLVRSSMSRIWEGAKDLAPHDYDVSAEPHGSSATDLWMLLIVRLVTRVAEPPPSDSPDGEEWDGDMTNGEMIGSLATHQDRLRQTLCDYIMSDFSGRLRLATTWMNEEWYNDQIRSQIDREWRPNYEPWLNQLVAMHETHMDVKDRSFSRFLLDLPSVPPDLLSSLREMCVEPDRRNVGFTALREFVQERPSLRGEAMTMLLELTTHPDKVTRVAAINTVKRWTDTPPMDNMIRDFALQLLRRLQSRPSVRKSSEPRINGDGGDESMEDEEDGQLPQEDIIQTPYLPEQLDLPAKGDQILQHLELIFALSTKIPEFLDEIFAAYGGMEETVQETIQRLITPLIRALGPSHGKLLTLLRTFPPGADSLALRVLTIFTEHGRPSGQLVALVKALMSERDLDPRFLIPIIAEMDKPDILRHLPRIVSILNGKPEPKALVRSVFESIVTTPPQSFGSVSSNLPRVRQSELLTPAELMVLLHKSESEIGLKAAMEAIGICFSMTDIYRSEILAVVMNQLVDNPILPTLFLRTVIQAVTTYRTLVGFVSTTLLSRLITKKVWTKPQLWEGFIRCAKLIAPASFGALLQLPKEQLRDLVDKQPSLKSGLREFVMKKGSNKARVAGLLDIIGEDDSASAHQSKTGSPAPSAVDRTPTRSTPEPASAPTLTMDISPGTPS